MRWRLLRAPLVFGALWLLADTRASAQDAALQREINEAIDRGVAYLRGIQDKDGQWSNINNNIGATALAAWTLLESGVPADDPAIQKAAKVVREGCITLTHNYSASLAIMFFDKLDNPVDEPLIESLALRLMVSQSSARGGWVYTLLAPPVSEVERLKSYVKQIEGNKGQREARKAPRKPGDPSQLAPEIRLQLANLFAKGLTTGDFGDNSNTQFAMLALWVARRHGLPVDASLALVERRFRATQSPLGAWLYWYDGQITVQDVREPFGTVQSMTCAGLLGLALGYQAAVDKAPKKAPRRELTTDPQVMAGLAVVGAFVGTPQADRAKIPLLKEHEQKAYYFLWTLERMAVVYGLKTIAKKDWYTWGAQILLVNQQPDGSWRGAYAAGGCDTCFALLFLKRANVAQDLTASLKGKVNDPGKASPQLLMMIGKQDDTAGAGTPKLDGQSKNDTAASETTPSALAGDAAKLSSALVDAGPAQQDALLQKLRDTPGQTYTQALAGAIPRLRGTAKSRARLALAQRFEKLDAEVLRLHLRATEPEVRRAAAVGAGSKKTRELIPDLIKLLEDQETTVLQAAHAALRQITDQDFGPELDATPAERAAALDAWRKWWKQQKS